MMDVDATLPSRRDLPLGGGRSASSAIRVLTCGNAGSGTCRRKCPGRDMDAMIQEFSLALAAEGKQAKTIKIYTDAAAWLQRAQGLTDWPEVKRSHVRAHLAHILEGHSDSCANQQYRSPRRFFAFLEEDEGIANPAANVKPPRIAEKLSSPRLGRRMERPGRHVLGQDVPRHPRQGDSRDVQGDGCPGWPRSPASRSPTQTSSSCPRSSRARTARCGSSASTPRARWRSCGAPGPEEPQACLQPDALGRRRWSAAQQRRLPDVPQPGGEGGRQDPPPPVPSHPRPSSGGVVRSRGACHPHRVGLPRGLQDPHRIPTTGPWQG